MQPHAATRAARDSKDKQQEWIRDLGRSSLMQPPPEADAATRNSSARAPRLGHLGPPAPSQRRPDISLAAAQGPPRFLRVVAAAAAHTPPERRARRSWAPVRDRGGRRLRLGRGRGLGRCLTEEYAGWRGACLVTHGAWRDREHGEAGRRFGPAHGRVCGAPAKRDRRGTPLWTHSPPSARRWGVAVGSAARARCTSKPPRGAQGGGPAAGRGPAAPRCRRPARLFILMNRGTRSSD